ncbi:MAG: phage capsid protein [Helicobacteraceae bacterium]|jgi:hypothetical protein|nr:phage capsid protein [Helicobacteraceae bacterium]
MSSNILLLQELIAKGTGVIAPTDVTYSGTLSPKQAKAFADAIIDKSGFLKKVTRDDMGKLTKERTASDIAKGQLTRFKSGERVSDDQMRKLNVIGCKLDATRGVTLNAKILKDALDDNQDNPKFEQEQFEAFSKSFGNDLAYLGFVGFADNDSVDAGFTELSKGWLQVAKESAETIKVECAEDKQIARLKFLVQNLNESVRGGYASIIMSGQDYDAYVLEIAEDHQNTAVLLKADAKTFMGYPIEVVNDMPVGVYLATPLANLVFGISKSISKERWWDSEASCLRFKFVVNPDYEIDIKKWVTLLTTRAWSVSAESINIEVGDEAIILVSGDVNLAKVSGYSQNDDVARVAFAGAEATITGVAAGETNVIISDGASYKTIRAIVSAAR